MKNIKKDKERFNTPCQLDVLFSRTYDSEQNIIVYICNRTNQRVVIDCNDASSKHVVRMDQGIKRAFIPICRLCDK